MYRIYFNFNNKRIRAIARKQQKNVAFSRFVCRVYLVNLFFFIFLLFVSCSSHYTVFIMPLFFPADFLFICLFVCYINIVILATFERIIMMDD